MRQLFGRGRLGPTGRGYVFGNGEEILEPKGESPPWVLGSEDFLEVCL